MRRLVKKLFKISLPFTKGLEDDGLFYPLSAFRTD
jgi:hypothetical protein